MSSKTALVVIAVRAGIFDGLRAFQFDESAGAHATEIKPVAEITLAARVA